MSRYSPSLAFSTKMMGKIVSAVWNEFIFGGHLLSLGAASVVWLVVIILDETLYVPLLLIPYFMSQIVYSHNHFKEAKLDILTNPERIEHNRELIKYFSAFMLLYFSGLFFTTVFFFDAKIIVFVLAAMIIGIFYTKFFKSLTKKVVGFKNFYVAFSWGILTVLPVLYYSQPFDLFFALVYLFVVLRLLVNTTFFDLKDTESDKLNGLKSLPVVFGKELTLNLLVLFNITSFVPLIVGVYLRTFPFFSVFLIVFFFYSLFYIRKARSLDSSSLRQTSYLMVDGEFIFWPIVLLVSKAFIT